MISFLDYDNANFEQALHLSLTMDTQRKKITAFKGLLLAALLVGFSGKEKFVELDGYLNGRSSASFTARDRNILKVLNKGTRGEILEYKKLPSGNYGLKIKAINGTSAGGTFWVYHNVKNSDLALFESVPSSWGVANSRAVSSVERAKGVETKRETQARTEQPAGNLSSASPARAIELIGKSNAQVQRAGESTCNNCTTAPPTAGQRAIVRSSGKQMPRACSALMDNSGQLGPHGQSIYSIMAESQYQRHFTANNSLGQFCPKFNQLNNQDKLIAWTWFWTALASEESGCNPTITHATHYRDRSGRVKVLNPVEGYGLWAMEKDRNVRRWRGAACSDIGTVAKQARCSIDIMASTQLTKGRTAGINNMSYWGPVRRGNSQIIPHMRRLSLCF